jgi:NAD(P)-dependent dehydrogenase (short-subunit alcohol dehydrogenase family)
MQSFTLAQAGSLGRSAPEKRVVLVTGASGNIGKYFAAHAGEKYELVLMVHSEKHRGELEPFGRVVTADLSDLDRLAKVCTEHRVDTVLHLAGAASPSSTWEDILQANIIGCYHLMIAAKAAGCRRVIYASSIHAVSGYPRDVQVKTTDPVNPGDLYGVSKCFGEALSRYMATQEGLSVIALRIGGFQPREDAKGDTGISMLDAFVSQEDLQQLIERCIDDTSLQFAIFNGLSGNRFLRLDISDARELLGYAPTLDTTAEHPGLTGLKLGEKVVAHNLSDKQSGYEPGTREELAEAEAVAGLAESGAGRTSEQPAARSRAGRKSSGSKESPMAAKKASEGKSKGQPANPADFGKKTTPVRERMAKAIKDTPPEERLKKGR